MKIKLKDKPIEIFYKNFVAGIGWVFGITVGFTALMGLLGMIVDGLGGLPVVGKFIASLIEATQASLSNSGF